MKNHYLKHAIALLVIPLFASLTHADTHSTKADTLETTANTAEVAIAAVLDNLHDAAAHGDNERYLGSFTDDGVFMGTDESERWPLPEFTTYVDGRFKDGKGWSYYSVERHIALAPSGETAWFDEITESEKWGRFRGTGVLLKQQGNWKVAHYSMTFLVPNEIWEEVSKLAKERKPTEEK